MLRQNFIFKLMYSGVEFLNPFVKLLLILTELTSVVLRSRDLSKWVLMHVYMYKKK